MSDFESDTKNSITSWLYHPFWGVFFFFFILKNWDILFPFLLFHDPLARAAYYTILHIEFLNLWRFEFNCISDLTFHYFYLNPRFLLPTIYTISYFFISPNLKNLKVLFDQLIDSNWNNWRDRAKLLDIRELNSSLKEEVEKYKTILKYESLLISCSTIAIKNNLLKFPNPQTQKELADFFILIAEEDNLLKKFISFDSRSKSFSLSFNSNHKQLTAFVYKNISPLDESGRRHRENVYLCLTKGFIELPTGFEEFDNLPVTGSKIEIIPSEVLGKPLLKTYDKNGSIGECEKIPDGFLYIDLHDDKYIYYKNQLGYKSPVFHNKFIN